MNFHSINGASPGWDVLQNHKARTMWLDGFSARRIAAVIGRTRNAVIGRANREGWGRHPYGHDPRVGE